MWMSVVNESVQNHTVKKTITCPEETVSVKLQQNTVHNLTDLQLSTVFSFFVTLGLKCDKIKKCCIIIFKSTF